MSLPAEIAIEIFSYLDAKDLISCSGVCYHWYLIVNELYKDEDIWAKYARKKYGALFPSAKMKAISIATNFDIYKSLTLWPQVKKARSHIIKFATSTLEYEDIKDFSVLGNSLMGVFKCHAIMYYNTDTLELCKPKKMGFYLSYAENEFLVLLLSIENKMYVTKKNMYHESEQSHIYCNDVKLYIIYRHDIYYVKTNNTVYLCDMSDIHLTECQLFTPDETIINLSYSNDTLYAMTSKHDIIYYDYRNRTVVTEPVDLATEPLKYIVQHGFMKNLNWQIYSKWLFSNDGELPLPLLEIASTIRVYGNIFALGTIVGQLYLYYFPNEFDFEKLELLGYWSVRAGKEACPILKIDMVEMINGHKIFVATSTKISTIELIHNY